MTKQRLRLVLEFWNDALGQHFAELHAPLVERVDLPNRTLSEHRMFVKSDELAESLRRQLVGENGVRRTVALKHPMRDEPIRRAFGFDFFRCLAERQRLGLGEDVCQEHVVLTTQGVERLSKRDEVTRN